MAKPELQSLGARIASLEPDERAKVIATLSGAERDQIQYVWPLWEHEKQREPDLPWRVWLVLAGRGFGKTRMGAEWVRRMAAADGRNRIALVAATIAEARAVMVEGASGILAVCPDEERPVWQPRWAGFDFRTGRGPRSIRRRSRTAFVGPSIISPGATRSPNGRSARRPGTI